MDQAITKAIESAYAIEREYGILCDQSSRSDASFIALRRLAETSDINVLADCPDWLLAELNAWVGEYRKTGKFGFISNLGSVDHSTLMDAASHFFADSK
jgi:hypothetical protein